jgi:ribonuclease Z
MVAMGLALGLTAGYSHAASNDAAVEATYDALEAKIAAGWDALAAREEQLLDKDRFTVVLCGTGTPINRDRANACTAVFVNGKFFVFDVGDGAVGSMEKMKLPLKHLSAVFLTHFHSDHMDDLAESIDRSFMVGRHTHLPIIGGEGIDDIVEGIRQSYALELSYRTAHHGEKVMPSKAAQDFKAETVRFDSRDEGKVVYDQAGVKVTAFWVSHEPIRPAMGYRVDYKGKSVVISGDTSMNPTLVKYTKGADVLVSEVMNNKITNQVERIQRKLGHPDRAKIFFDIRDSYHLSNAEVGTLATDAGVKTLMLTHLIPNSQNDDLMKLYFEDEIAEYYDGEILIGKDGMEFVLP